MFLPQTDSEQSAVSGGGWDMRCDMVRHEELN
jgi:hypothetical protein